MNVTQTTEGVTEDQEGWKEGTEVKHKHEEISEPEKTHDDAQDPKEAEKVDREEKKDQTHTYRQEETTHTCDSPIIKDETGTAISKINNKISPNTCSPKVKMISLKPPSNTDVKGPRKRQTHKSVKSQLRGYRDIRQYIHVVALEDKMQINERESGFREGQEGDGRAGLEGSMLGEVNRGSSRTLGKSKSPGTPTRPDKQGPPGTKLTSSYSVDF